MKITHYVNNETGKVENAYDSKHDAATAAPTIEGYTPILTHDEIEVCQYCKVNPFTAVAPTPGQIVTYSGKTPPTYYTGSGKIDVIDFMTPQVAPEQMEGFFRMNAMKYLTRYDKKGTPVDDLEKASVYLNKLIEHVKQNNPVK